MISTERGRNLQIDVLRGISILAILFCHFSQFYASAKPSTSNSVVESLGAIAPRGVQIFFIISAISLNLNTSILMENSIRAWYRARFWRIYPIWLFAVLSTAIFDQLLHFRSISFASLITSSTFTFGFTRAFSIPEVVIGGWSLFCEICFYCIFPYLTRRLGTPYRAALFFVICLLCRYIWLKSAHILNLSNLNEFRELFPLAQVHAFALGHLIYILIQRYQSSINRSVRFLAIVFGLFGIWNIRFENGIATLIIGWTIFFYLTGAETTLSRSNVKNGIRASIRFLATCLAFFGKRTYTYYLYEFLILDFFSLILTYFYSPPLVMKFFPLAFTSFLLFTVSLCALPYRLEILVSKLRRRLFK